MGHFHYYKKKFKVEVHNLAVLHAPRPHCRYSLTTIQLKKSVKGPMYYYNKNMSKLDQKKSRITTFWLCAKMFNRHQAPIVLIHGTKINMKIICQSIYALLKDFKKHIHNCHILEQPKSVLHTSSLPLYLVPHHVPGLKNIGSGTSEKSL